MINDKGILIKNIFYMLSYAYKALNQSNYQKVDVEDFKHIEDLFGAILSKGMIQLSKQGLYREYLEQNDSITSVRGRIDFAETVKNVIQKKKLIHCSYDELSENNTLNQILKTTAELLVVHKDVVKSRKDLKNALFAFRGVGSINLKQIKWNMVKFPKHNQNYRMLLFICYFVINKLLLSTEKGNYNMRMFEEDQMHWVYEKFILEYYKKNHPELGVSAKEIKWEIDDDSKTNTEALSFLPKMKTDITLQNKQTGNTIIIDAKYYGSILQKSFNKETIRNAHLNQVITYLLNDDPDGSKGTKGILLYAKPEGSINPDWDYTLAGRHISVKDLDLNTDFSAIKRKLDSII